MPSSLPANSPSPPHAPLLPSLHLPPQQELRGGLAAFRKGVDARPPGSSGAVSVAFAPAFGEAGSNGTLQYYLASAFDRVRHVGGIGGGGGEGRMPCAQDAGECGPREEAVTLSAVIPSAVTLQAASLTAMVQKPSQLPPNCRNSLAVPHTQWICQLAGTNGVKTTVLMPKQGDMGPCACGG